MIAASMDSLASKTPIRDVEGIPSEARSSAVAKLQPHPKLIAAAAEKRRLLEEDNRRIILSFLSVMESTGTIGTRL